ncbi:MAG: peptidoglycan editing factor PgeF [Duncaniella sp.]|nr:peptidoglycan editing factor PgeF [Duncaniella sp.]
MTDLSDILHPLPLPGNPVGVHVYCTRRGPEAVTDDHYSGFNICDYTGDVPGHIAECRSALCSHFDIPLSDLVLPRQTHSAEVAVTDGTPMNLHGVDGLITSRPRLLIGVSTADCVPVVLADPVGRRIAVVHAGWRGAVGGIVENALARMASLGSDPADILVAFGPSICPGCFEVGEEVAVRFPEFCVDRSLPKPHVDLHTFIASRLQDCGVPVSNISPFDSTLCTRCHPDQFFSARASGVASGRVTTIAYLDGV